MTEAVRIPSVLGIKTTGDHIKVQDLAHYRDACSNLFLDTVAKDAEIERLRDKIAKLQAIIDKQLY